MAEPLPSNANGRSEVLRPLAAGWVPKSLDARGAGSCRRGGTTLATRTTMAAGTTMAARSALTAGAVAEEGLALAGVEHRGDRDQGLDRWGRGREGRQGGLVTGLQEGDHRRLVIGRGGVGRFARLHQGVD